MPNKKINAIVGDITTLKLDAIVNAANGTLLGGGGVDGAIHRAAGPQLLAECRTLGGCETGRTKATAGYRLPATYVFHTVGPVWHGGMHDEAQLLESCYRTSLDLAVRYGCSTIAFPCISTGVYGFPHEPAAEIAVTVCSGFLDAHDTAPDVTFCCFLEQDYLIYQKLLAKI